VERISSELSACLQSNKIKKVYIAGRQLAPPQMAFVVRFPRLSLTLSGTDEIEIEHGATSRLLTLRKGEAVFVPPNCWNRPMWRLPVKTLHLLFGEKLIGMSMVDHEGGQGIEQAHVWKSGIPWRVGDPTSEILKALTAIAAQERTAPMDAMLVNALLYATLQSMQHPTVHLSGKGRDRFERICLYVQEHCHQDITRESVAEQFRLSPNHLSRLFHQEGLMKYNDYVARVRIDRAKYLLASYDVPLDEVAVACGFRDTCYFCRVFKKRTGQTPTHYRLAR
jgi:AraC-like DNA-binding protein